MRRERRQKMRMAAVGGLALLAAGAVVAVTTGDGRGTGSTAGETAADAPGRVAAGSSSAKTGDNGFTSSPGLSAPSATRTVDPAGPKIVRTGELSVRVEEGRLTTAFDRVASIASVNGGFVVSSSTVTQGEEVRRENARPRAGDVTIRVAADRFDAARRALAELGTVERESVRGEDVSGQLVDYEARLRSLAAQEDALRTLLSRASGVAEVLQVQNALFDVRQQTEQLQAQRDQLSQAAALSTLQVSLFEPGAASSPEPEPAGSLARSFERAVEGALAVVGGMIVVLGWLAPVGAVVLLIWGVTRLRHRRPAPSTPAPAAP